VRADDQGGPTERDPGVAEAPRRGSAAPAGALSDVADFLRLYAPFDALSQADVELIAASAEVEFHLAGTTIFSQGAETVHYVRVVRSGAVELIHDGVVLDLLGVGELFGHSSMLSGLPTGFTARALEDTLCYRIGADVALPALARPESVVFVARSLLASPNVYGEEGAPSVATPRDPAHQPVGSLIRGRPVAVAPETSIREAARMMNAAGASAVVVRLEGSLGIVTDRDLRSRVVADGVAVDDPISVVMTAPAYTVAPDRLGGGVLLEMLDRGIRHFPVISARGELVGVVEDLDLIAVETRNSFYVRGQIAAAATVDELAEAAQQIKPMVIALHDTRLAATSISAIYSVVRDALTRRAVELAVAGGGRAPHPLAGGARGRPARPTSRSPGSRSAARRAARPSRAPTSTPRSSGTATATSARSARTCTRSARAPWPRSRPAACAPTARARARRTCASSARSSRGGGSRAAGSRTPPRRRL
jgi:CBS domain-containing protein